MAARENAAIWCFVEKRIVDVARQLVPTPDDTVFEKFPDRKIRHAGSSSAVLSHQRKNFPGITAEFRGTPIPVSLHETSQTMI
jgi:hypothetical protein